MQHHHSSNHDASPNKAIEYRNTRKSKSEHRRGHWKEEDRDGEIFRVPSVCTPQHEVIPLWEERRRKANPSWSHSFRESNSISKITTRNKSTQTQDPPDGAMETERTQQRDRNSRKSSRDLERREAKREVKGAISVSHVPDTQRERIQSRSRRDTTKAHRSI